MLLRSENDGVLAIGQASHAWLSGQLARAWGNDRFGAVLPNEEVCLAAEQHDVGMAAWDLEPMLDAKTGLPYSFMEMPLDTHLDLWTAGSRRLISQSRYAALLVCCHGAWLYEQRDLNSLADSEVRAVCAFLERQYALQQGLLASLRADPLTAPAADPDLVTRNRALIRTWDFLSLALCLDWAPTCAAAVPSTEGECELRLTRGRPGQLNLDPWPFGSTQIDVRVEGRRLTGLYASDGELREALQEAHWETVRFELRPAQG